MGNSLTWASVVLLIAIVARRIDRTWLAPGAWFALIWALASVPSAIAIPRAVSSTSLMLVSLFGACAVGGSVLGSVAFGVAHKASIVTDVKQSPQRFVEPEFVSGFACLFGLGGLVACFWYVANYGASVSELTSPETWFAMASQYSIDRYFGGFVEPISIRVLLAMNYSGAMLAGLALGLAATRVSRLSAALPMGAGTLITIITTAKAPMLLSALFMLSGWMAAAAPEQAARRHRSFLFVAIAAVLLVAGIGSMVLRYGLEESDTIGLLSERISGYFFGHMAALSAWLSWDGVAQASVAMGKESFAGVAELLGLRTRDIGIYSSIPLTAAAADSNVFTALRGLIVDYTLPGAALVVGLVSALASFAWSVQRCGHGRAGGWIILTVFYALVGWSPVISLFVYNVVLLAIAVTWVVLVVGQHRVISTSLRIGSSAS